MKLAKRLQLIEPFRVMELLGRARELEAQGRSIIHMEIGEPDFETPEPISRAGTVAVSQGHTHYTPAVGLPALREAISHHYKVQHGLAVDACRVVVTPGSSGALLLALAAILNPGDKVLMTDPTYPCNRNFVHLFEGEIVTVPLRPDNGFQLTVEMLEQYWEDDIRAVMLASPSNPTGTLIPADALEAMVEFIRSRNATLIMDEIYHGLVYGEQATTALSCSDDVIVINSFSKYYGMTGWRCGWMVAPLSLVPELDKLAQNIFLAAPTPAQHAAVAAFSDESRAIIDTRRDEFRRRRDFLLPALQELGFDIPVQPQGAFYLYAGCQDLTEDSFVFCEQLLEQAGVAVTPGRDFCLQHAERYVRFAYTTTLDKLEQGVERIRKFLDS